MAKDQGIVQTAMRRRTPFKTPPSPGAGSPPEEKKRGVGLVDILSGRFFREVQAESRKITWTTWKETWITSVMVAIMVVITAIFFWVVDAGLNFAVGQILKLANAG